MKIAIITDVHGNAPALDAVLAEIDAAGDMERIYCLGDMIGIGPDTNEVLARLTGRSDVSFVTGNHELAVLHIIDGRGCLNGHETAYAHHQWIAERLDPRYIPFLNGLPVSEQVQVGGVSILMTHYHLRADGQFEPIDARPDGLKLDALYSGTGYDLVCFGHHHPLHLFETASRTYLNPGALGCYVIPKARYAIVRAAGGAVTIECKEADYDNRAFLRSYLDLDVPDATFILQAFHGNQIGR
ncbi:metallophosphoesterase family protein [Paenibacillus ginsengarvi]|uniref:Metallophosphoesterase n=1 Tax=Paenibacillus ginsengarvi TaxID=400777 RepID=A0A3B0CP75_9BACL|nr:metallophosphoesterase family protein [Paenibacillus ginsengarvi]RKN86580.1 metallophosphoesterase [Paenibacillus ginsengarvi]